MLLLVCLTSTEAGEEPQGTPEALEDEGDNREEREGVKLEYTERLEDTNEDGEGGKEWERAREGENGERDSEGERGRFFAFIVMPGTGHHQRMSSIAFELYRRGHRVLYMSTDYLLPKFLGDYEHFHSQVSAGDLPPTSAIEFFSLGSSDDMVTENQRFRDLSELSGVSPDEWHRYMQQPVLDKLRERLPDLLVIDAMAVVGYDARIEFDLRAVAVHPTTIQVPLQQSWHFPSFAHPLAWEESSNLVGHVMTVAYACLNYNTWRAHTRAFNAIKLLSGTGQYQEDPMHNFWFDIPSFVFSLPSLNLNAPLPEYAVHYVGLPHHRGLSGQPLDQELVEWIDADSRPVVYVAFGTVALPAPEHVQPLQLGLRSGPWKVVWAMRPAVSRYFEELGTDTWRTAENFIVREWVAQPELLRHPRVELFVTHGGCNSISEAVASGTPMICVPYLGDQPSNCFRAAEAGVAMRMIEGHEHAMDGSGYARMVSRALGITEPGASESISSYVRRRSVAEETRRALRQAAEEMKLLAERYGRSDIRAADLIEFFAEVEDFNSLTDMATHIGEGDRMAFDLFSVGIVLFVAAALAVATLKLCCRCCCRKKSLPNYSTHDNVVVADSSGKKKRKKDNQKERT